MGRGTGSGGDGPSRPALATRLARLGTETAYVVALEAGELKASGAKVLPFHIGDLNFSTPACVVQSCKDALDAGHTGYCAAAGIPELRKALADHYNETFGLSFGPENVSVQSGGKPAIGKFLMVCVNEGEEVLFPSPGYPIYESMAKFLNLTATPYEYTETKEGGWTLDIEALEKLVTPKTKAIIVNNFQNPVGVAHTRAEMEALAAFAVKHDLFVMSDDPYYQITFSDFDKSDFVHISSLPGMTDRTICAYTYSKSFAMTGWRLGAVLGPQAIVDAVTKINTNDEACTTHFIQKAGVTALTHPDAKAFTKNMVAELEVRRDLLAKELSTVPGFVPLIPKATFYMMVNVTAAMALVGTDSLEDFRRAVLKGTGVSFCTRAHFGTPLEGERQRYVRFAFSGVTTADIEATGAALRPFFEALKK